MRLVEAALFLADGQTDRQTDRHDEANSRFSKYLRTYVKIAFF